MLFRNFELIIKQLQAELKYWVPLLFYTLKLLAVEAFPLIYTKILDLPIIFA